MDREVISQSVTQDDYTDKAGRQGSILNLMVSPHYQNAVVGLPVTPPAFWSHQRDEVLRSSVYAESHWASAIFTAISKMSSLSWKIKGESAKARRMRDLFVSADGNRGWVSFLSKHLRDYLLTDNGAFIEIVRASSSEGSKILGLMHLDSLRCTRTGDPDIPVIYRDKKNNYHELKAHQVICLSDLEDPSEMWYGVGMSAASRAYRQIYKLSAMESYLEDKVTGRRPLRIYLVNNINMEQMQGAVRLAEVDRSSQGYVSYMGAVIVPNIDPTTAPGVATIDLAGLPENYDPETERRNCKLAYAKAIGLDPQDVDPQLLASKALGTGAQARVIDDKASGSGIVAWRQQLIHLLNEFVLPEYVSFYFMEGDLRDQLQRQQIEAQRTTTNVERVNAGIITPEMAKQLLIDAEDLPAEFSDVDITPIEETSSDTNPGEPNLSTGDASAVSQQTAAPSTVNTEGMPKIPDNPNSEAGLGTRSTYATPDDAGKKLKPTAAKKEIEIVQDHLDDLGVPRSEQFIEEI